jgi:hypothetical protein
LLIESRWNVSGFSINNHQSTIINMLSERPPYRKSNGATQDRDPAVWAIPAGGRVEAIQASGASAYLSAILAAS